MLGSQLVTSSPAGTSAECTGSADTGGRQRVNGEDREIAGREESDTDRGWILGTSVQGEEESSRASSHEASVRRQRWNGGQEFHHRYVD